MSTPALSIKERIDAIMEQAQCFASTWSSVGGPFDRGDTLQRAEAEKVGLRRLVAEALEPVEPAEPAEPSDGVRHQAVVHCAEILAAHKFNVTGMPAHLVHSKVVEIGEALGGIPQQVTEEVQEELAARALIASHNRTER